MVELRRHVSVFVLAAGGMLAGATGCAAAYVAPLSARACATVVLTKDGRLRTCELAEATRVQGHAFPARAQLTFRPDGTLEHAVYVEASGFMIHGEAWRDTATVNYDRSGAVTAKLVDRWQSPPDVRHDPVPRNFR